jgi:hypothetical protein
MPSGTPIPHSVRSVPDDEEEEYNEELNVQPVAVHNVHILEAGHHKVAGFHQRGTTSVVTFIRWLDYVLDIEEPWTLSTTGGAATFFARETTAILSPGEYLIVSAREYFFLKVSHKLTSWKGITARYRPCSNPISI